MSRTLTPLCDFVRDYVQSDAHRLHMPGHKGISILGNEAFDITEIDGADVLYHPHGILAESQSIARDLFGTKKTLYSAEGSSLSIRAMLYLALLDAKQNGRSQTIVAARNAHKVFLLSSALLRFDIDWMRSDADDSLLSCRITSNALDEKLSSYAVPPAAVYITSPDYLGNLQDISALTEVCHKHGTLLLTDNAHGAYLHFLDTPIHPMDLGADICCDSAHKTLPVLTGGGYLHLSHRVSDMLCDQAEHAMALFASTSPSYLILQSLDAANGYLSADYRAELKRLCARMHALSQTLIRHGYALCGDETCKLTIAPKSFGYSGDDLAAILIENRLIPEFYDPDFVVLMVTPMTSDETLWHLERTLTALPRKAPIAEASPHLPVLPVICTPTEAILSPSVTLPVEDCAGRILAQPSVSCPPAIPIAVSGEEITAEAIKAFRYWGIETCSVLL